MSLSKEWREFIDDYLSDKSHWYVPKARSVGKENVPLFQQELKILLKDYQDQIWDKECEELFARDMEKAGLYKPREIHPDNFSFRAREEKQVFSLLGLAWVDDEKKLHVTKVGNALVEAADPISLLSFQVLKWQFWNPSARDIDGSLHKIQLSPHLTLLKILRNVNKNIISRNEFCLFVAKCKTIDAVKEASGTRLYQRSVLTQIQEFRELSKTRREELINTIKEYNHGRNILTTIEQDYGYILSFLTYPPYLMVDNNEIILTNKKLAASTGEYWDSQFAYVPFDTQSEWMDFYGDPWRGQSLEEALERYEDKHDIESAKKLYHKARIKRAPGTERSEEEFIRDFIQEIELENWLSKHLEVVSTDLKLYSDNNGTGRQYPAGPWAIDLLARDSKGIFVVIELKKRLASDQVFGQLCRYVGWVREYLADGANVKGIIIAKELDNHLKYALRAIVGTEEILKGFAWSDLGVQFEDRGHDAKGNPIIRVIGPTIKNDTKKLILAKKGGRI